jgi:ribosomal protein S18 acetylase RimI-like enzyme
MNVTTRPARADDLDHVKWALYTAVSWSSERSIPPYEEVIDHPELARYHHGWMRPGDRGVVAEADGAVVGVALCRLFTEADHGHGYVDDQTPELAVAVAEACRGRGVGARLMEELAEQVRAAGYEQLSLSVDTENPARHLYDRLGYVTVFEDEGGARMILDLRQPRS